MPEWLYEAGIGEARAALVDCGHILELAIEPDDDAPRAGAILPARLLRGADARGRGRVALAGGGEADLQPVPAGLTEGAALLVELVREALPLPHDPKPPRVRPADPAATPQPGPDLLARCLAGGHPVIHLGVGPDRLEEHGWSEAIEAAMTGIVATPELLLRISLTPAMTLIDVDGALPAPALAIAGARAAGAAIRRFGIAGSIGIDLPTLPSRADRQAAAAALDAALPQPFERTAVNGFGFLQIVRRRIRASLPEQLAIDPLGHAARALLRRAERAGGHGALTLAAAPRVIERLAAWPDWIDTLARRAGAAVRLAKDPALAISAGHAQRDQP